MGKTNRKEQINSVPISRFQIDSLLSAFDQDQTLLTPNHRSAKVIMQAYANKKKVGEVWSRPQVFAIDIWLQQLWAKLSMNGIEPFCKLQILDSFSEQCVWTEQLKASAEKYPLLNIQETAAAVSHSYHIYNQWFLFEKLKPRDSKYSQNFSAFLYWSKHYKYLLEKHELIGLSDAILILIPSLHELVRFLPSRVLLVNFSDPPPLYARLIGTLEDVIELSYHTRNTPDISSKTIPNEWQPNLNSVKRLQFPNLDTEIRACVRYSLERVRVNETEHVGIIIDHEKEHDFLFWKEFNRQTSHRNNDLSPTKAQYFNTFSSAQSLADVKSIELALSFLELNQTRIETQKFCHLLQCHQFALGDKELSARISLELLLRNNFSSTTRLGHLQSVMQREGKPYYCPHLSTLLTKFSELSRRPREFLSLSAWAELFTRQLELIGWPRFESEDYLQWQKSLYQLSSTSAIVGELDITGALRQLRSLLYQTPRRIVFNDELQISLVSLDEALDFDFDSLWFISADDQRLPCSISPDTFLPLSIQQEYGMPRSSYKLQLEQANLILTRLQRNTHEFILSHHKYEGDLEIRPSPLSRTIPLSPVPDIGSTNNLTNPLHPVEFEYVQEPLCLPLTSVIGTGGTSLLSNQSNCPFKAFATHRLGAQKLPNLQPGLDAMNRGSALHLALEKLSTKLNHQEKILESSAAIRQKFIDESIEPAIGQMHKQHPDVMTPTFSNLERIRLSNLLNSFLEFELSRSPFLVHETEQQITWDHSLLSLNFRVDRIDKLNDDSLVLIDYKSGKKSSYRWFDDRPDDLQLPLYQLAIGSNIGHISGAFIYQVNIKEVTLAGATDKEDLHPDIKPLAQVRLFDGTWTDLQERWNIIVLAIAAEFEKGLLAVAPTRGNQTCQYCDLSSLCRINDQKNLLDKQDELTP